MGARGDLWKLCHSPSRRGITRQADRTSLPQVSSTLQSAPGVSVAPDPFDHTLMLRTGAEAIRHQLRSVDGRVLATGWAAANAQVPLPVEGLSAGCYLLQLVSTDGRRTEVVRVSEGVGDVRRSSRWRSVLRSAESALHFPLETWGGPPLTNPVQNGSYGPDRS